METAFPPKRNYLSTRQGFPLCDKEAYMGSGGTVPHILNLTHCGRVTQICVFNTVKLSTFASFP